MSGVRVYEPSSGQTIETVDNGAGEQRQVVAAHIITDGVETGASHRLPVDVGDLSVQNLTVTFPNSVVSTLNSTNVALGANATFTGGWEEVTKYSAISVLGLADQASALNGALVEFSNDASTVVRTIAATIPAATGLTFMFAPEARYFRIVYTNGSVAQTSFIVQSILHYQFPSPPQLPLAATTSDISLGESGVAHLKARLASGIWTSIAATAAGALVVDGSATTQPVSGTVAISGTPTVDISNTPTVNQGTPAVHANGWEVTDYYETLETLDDQNGAGTVLTFTFTSTPKLIVVYSSGGVSRANISGTPSSTNGVYCDKDCATFIPIRSQTLKVFANTGTVVSVWGMS